MTEEPMSLSKTFVRWLASFAIVGGFVYFHTPAPRGTIILAGLGTLVTVLVTTWMIRSRHPKA
ncbi:MAG TPA: hypothetical protein VMU17_04455 [Elusimicrobiota bacterium]|nr:hypothetical protein [Elusimicrobiota bacterium]